jgi:UBX domain-containing protein 1
VGRFRGIIIEASRLTSPLLPRLVARLNLTHTVGDIRGFITASQPGDRAFTIQTTFPNKVLADDSQTVEQANLANAVIVQRWA